MILAIIGLTPSLRESFRQWFRGPDRHVLATLRDDLTGSGQQYTVFKIKENGRLFLEFYGFANKAEESALEANGAMELLQTLELANPIDGYVTFMGAATNLAVANLDGEPNLELLVPSFNLEFAASLDVVRYDFATKRFEFMNGLSLPADLVQGIQRNQNGK
jgi:hypothetical protein